MRNKKAKQQTDMLPVVLMAVGFLLIVGVLIWQVVRSQQNTQANSPAGQNNSAGAAQAPAGTNPTLDPARPEPGIPRVPLADAKTAFDNKTAVFLDARDQGSYNTGHIPGAVNIPLALLENRINELNPNQWIIAYCT